MTDSQLTEMMTILYQEQRRQIEIRETPHQHTKIRQRAQADLDTLSAMIAYVKQQYPRVLELDVVKEHLLYFQKKN